MCAYFKTPFNYIGGKYNLLSQIIPLFPGRIDCMVDLFGGGFNVGLNTQSDLLVYNDMVTPLVELWEYFYCNYTHGILSDVERVIMEYGLSRVDKGSFYRLRDVYNCEPNPLLFYVLMCYSYNYQFRFNGSGEYNSSHGTNRSSFTSLMRERLVNSLSVLHHRDVLFFNMDFEDLIQQLIYDKVLTCDSLVYCDPPYLLGTGNYNDGKRGFKMWTREDEQRLYNMLSMLDENDVNFALSNITHHKSRDNDVLLDWIQNNDYHVHHLDKNYNNCSYNTGKSSTVEVLITNYK